MANNPNFVPVYSTNEVYFDERQDICLTDMLLEKADVDHTHEDYATATHTHDGYASQDDLDLLEDVVATKADAEHYHTGYAPVGHSHNGYVLQTEFDELELVVNGKADANHSHADYASVSHLHTEYAELSHSHTASEIGAAESGHNHDSVYATVTSLNELSTTVSGKANTSHSHNDMYYTETEVDTKLAGKSDSSHVHDNAYDAIGSAASALTSANSYTDSKIDALVGEGAAETLNTISEISSAIEGNQDAIDLLNSAIANKANASHTHAVSEVTNLQDTLDSKAESIHAHAISDITNLQSALDSKAASGHNHDSVYYTETEVDTLLADKANSSHTHDYVPTFRTVNGKALTANITLSASDVGALPSDTEIPSALVDLTADSTHRLVTDVEKAIWNAKSDFSGNYNDLTNKPSIPSIDGLATETYVDTQIGAIDIPSALSDLTTDATHRVVTDAEKTAWNAKSNFSGSYNDLTDKPSIPSISGLATETYVDEAVSAKANSSHTHDDRYYTETEINTKLSAKSDTTHNHNSSYDALGAASNALASAKEYSDELIADEVTARDSAIATAKSSAISTAASDATTKANNALASAKTYADSVGATIKNDLLNGAGTAYDTLKELGDLIDDNADAIDALETVASGKANAVHGHAISDVTGLQSALDGKAASSHGTHVSFSTTAPVMDGTASVGTASTVARSDHKHPTDTSRAAQTALDALSDVVAGKANSSHTHTIANITNLQTTLDGKAASSHTHTVSQISDLTATAKELNYMDGVTSNVQTQLDGKAASGHTHAAATTSASGLMTAAMVTKLNGIATGANAYTLPTASSTLGGVKTTSTVTSASGYTACPIIGGVPYYKDTNTTYNLGSFGITATAAELNYVDGVTSSIQTQLNGKLSTTGKAASATTADSATNVAWSGVTSKPSYYDAKAIKSITRSGTTFTYTCMDGTTGTFTQQDNNTTYSAVTTSANGLMIASDKVKLNSMELATVSEVETYLAI